MKQFFRKTWSFLGASPLWVKIMGIVAFPLFLVILFLFLELRRAVFVLLATEQHAEVWPLLSLLLTQRSLIILLITLLTGILLAYFLSRILTRPLLQLLAAIHQAQGGNLNARVQVWANDEIGQVQGAFNGMVAELEQNQKYLKERNQDLSLANRIAIAVAEGQNVEAIMEAAIREAVQLTGADQGTLYLYDPQSATFSLQVIQGSPSAELRNVLQIREAQNSGMTRSVESGKVFIIDDIVSNKEVRTNIRELLDREGLHAWACAPIKVKGDVIGVFNLMKTEVASFSARDAQLLETLGGFIGVALANARLLEDLHKKEAELRRALRRSVQGQEEERMRLSRELHDEVGQALTSILIRLRSLQEEQDLEIIHQRLDGMRYLTGQAIEELRRLSMDLRPAALDNLGIMPALRWYIQQMAERSGVQIQLHGPERLERLPAEVEVVLYRIAQEGLTNALRHAQPRNILVDLEHGPHSIWLTISDDGQGFDPNAADHGLGLVGVRERVDLLGGAYKIETSPGSGTRLWVELPAPERASAHAE